MKCETISCTKEATKEVFLYRFGVKIKIRLCADDAQKLEGQEALAV
jgi:hypothetical protein